MKKTKIICTLGPASRDEKTIEKMLLSGMNVARINFSHGTHEYHKETIDTFRKVRDRLNLPAAVMLDTKGPEIRLRDFEGGKVTLKKGEVFTLTTKELMGNSEIASISYKDLPSQLTKGNKVLIDDGKVSLEVIETNDTDIKCKVLVGGEISNHKGINIPNVHLDFDYLSEQDKLDLQFGVKEDVDFRVEWNNEVYTIDDLEILGMKYEFRGDKETSDKIKEVIKKAVLEIREKYPD